jgi:hypothetical protein
MSDTGGVADRLRQPEYTGENRCIPCTVANVCIAVGLSGGVAAGVGVAVGTLAAGLAGGAVLVASLTAIYVRGYLVPGTPTLTKRYFPDRVLRLFDKHEETRASAEGTADIDPTEEVDVEAWLVDHGLLTECENRDDLCLTDDLEAAWATELAAIRDGDLDRAVLANLLDVDRATLQFRDHGEAFVAMVGTDRVGQWESEAAFLADVAAARTLEDRTADWSRLSLGARGQILGGLRLFLERCPSCRGGLDFSEDTVESCCRTIDVVALRCRDCDARLFEIEHPGVGA